MKRQIRFRVTFSFIALQKGMLLGLGRPELRGCPLSASATTSSRNACIFSLWSRSGPAGSDARYFLHSSVNLRFLLFLPAHCFMCSSPFIC